MRNILHFDGKRSSNYGVYISGSGVYNAPRRAYKAVTVPGRNGDLLLQGERYENIEVTYPAFIYADFKNNIAAFRNALLATNGYAKLTDTYHPDEFRAAYYEGEFEVEPREQNDAGEFEITFICKPQRYLNSGEAEQAVSSGGHLDNPTLFASKPVIAVRGYGQITVGNNVISINQHPYPYIIIDSEIMDCYGASGPPLVNSAIVGTAVLGYGNYLGNANMIVTFVSGDFPELAPGSTGVTFTNTIQSVAITPRWWRL